MCFARTLLGAASQPTPVQEMTQDTRSPNPPLNEQEWVHPM